MMDDAIALTAHSANAVYICIWMLCNLFIKPILQ